MYICKSGGCLSDVSWLFKWSLGGKISTLTILFFPKGWFNHHIVTHWQFVVFTWMDFKQFGERNKLRNSKLNEHVRSMDTDLCKDGYLPEDPQRKSEVVDVGSSSWILRVKLEIFLQTGRHDVWYGDIIKFSGLRQVYPKMVLLSKRLNFCQTYIILGAKSILYRK